MNKDLILKMKTPRNKTEDQLFTRSIGKGIGVEQIVVTDIPEEIESNSDTVHSTNTVVPLKMIEIQEIIVDNKNKRFILRFGANNT